MIIMLLEKCFIDVINVLFKLKMFVMFQIIIHAFTILFYLNMFKY